MARASLAHECPMAGPISRAAKDLSKMAETRQGMREGSVSALPDLRVKLVK